MYFGTGYSIRLGPADQPADRFLYRAAFNL
jgi:hypothetical protein